MLSLEVDLTFHMDKKHDRIEMFNLRNINFQKIFKEYTSQNTTLSYCFITNESVDVQFLKWQRKFQKALHACFRKIRIRDNKNKMSDIDTFIKEKSDILKKKNLNPNEKEKVDIID